MRLFSENATYVPSFDFSPIISIGGDHVQIFFSNVNVCPAWSPASAVPTTSGFGHCILPATLVCAATADANNNARPTVLTMCSFIEPPDFECFASTGVNTPETMFPNFGSRGVHFLLYDRAHSDGLDVAERQGAHQWWRTQRASCDPSCVPSKPSTCCLLPLSRVCEDPPRVRHNFVNLLMSLWARDGSRLVYDKAQGSRDCGRLRAVRANRIPACKRTWHDHTRNAVGICTGKVPCAISSKNPDVGGREGRRGKTRNLPSNRALSKERVFAFECGQGAALWRDLLSRSSGDQEG